MVAILWAQFCACVKTGQKIKYFVRRLSDGEKPICMVYFREKRRPGYENYLKSGKMMKLSRIATKEAVDKDRNSTIEIFTKEAVLSESSQKVKLTAKQRLSIPIKVATIKNMADDVHIRAKVIEMLPKKETQTKDGLTFRQEAVLADEIDTQTGAIE